jgi:hypothetical protein
MWIFIAGMKDVERDLGAGSFHCPQCRADTPCTRRKVSRYLTLFFIPLIPLGDRGEVVRCDRCGSSFGAPPADDRGDVWRCARCGNVNPVDRSACVACGGPRD